jgi:dihydrofolate reductase
MLGLAFTIDHPERHRDTRPVAKNGHEPVLQNRCIRAVTYGKNGQVHPPASSRKLIESTHVALGGQIDPLGWAFPYLDDDHTSYATELLDEADALLLGRRTYEGLSAGYTAMDSSPFVDRMNSIPKYVASTTLTEATWNTTIIPGDVTDFVADLKRQPGGTILKYGNGPLDQTLMASGLIDEFHLLLTPVAAGSGQHMFEKIHGAPQLSLADVRRFNGGM